MRDDRKMQAAVGVAGKFKWGMLTLLVERRSGIFMYMKCL